jgi:kynurenine 3-monooxygenase
MRPKGRSVDPEEANISRDEKKMPTRSPGLAIENFIEMRDKTASRTFRAKKKLDHLLEALLPGIYLPLYRMVTFTRIPYAEAARRARRQDRIVYSSLALLALMSALLIIRFVAR